VETAKCGSSQRTKYENPERREYSGAGLPYIAIIYRTCRCLDCGQARRDQERVYAPKGTAVEASNVPLAPAALAPNPEDFNLNL
jgi:hypothetical protein